MGLNPIVMSAKQETDDKLQPLSVSLIHFNGIDMVHTYQAAQSLLKQYVGHI